MIKKYAHYSIILLMLCGWFLNGKYYFSRFISEGFEDWLSVIIATTLVIFATFCFYSYHKMKVKNKKLAKWIFKLLYFALALYSINCTSAGQYWDQQKINEKTNTIIVEKENQQYLLSIYQKNRDYTNNEILRLTGIQSNTIKNLDDTWSYQEEYDQNEEKIKDLKAELGEIESKIVDILEQNKISAKMEDIKRSKQLYEFYQNILKIQIMVDVEKIKDGEKIIEKENHGYELIQFFFQLLLSIFIESIAQVSIFIFMQFDIKVYNKDYQISRDKILTFCAHAWKDIDGSGKDSLVSKDEIIRLSNQHIIDETKRINKHDYEYLIKTGLKAGLLKRINGNIKPSEHTKSSEVFYNKILDLIEI